MWKLFLIGLLAYLLGSMPFSLWTGKLLHKKDIREFGSGNLGATNSFRVLGKKTGILVAVMDVLKGTLAACLPLLFSTQVHPLFFGILAIIGHSYPIFAGFKGGKSVATSAGVLLALHPMFLVAMVAVFGVTLFLTSIVSFSSMLTVGVAALCSFYYNDTVLITVLWIVFIFIVFRHRENVVRILNCSEREVPFGLHLLQKKC